MPPIIRTALHAVVIAVSAVAILFPESRVVARPFVLSLYFVMFADMTVQGWRDGYLQKPFRELAKNPPRTGPVELAANAFGIIAMFLVL